MTMKKAIVMVLVICLLLTGCASSQGNGSEDAVPAAITSATKNVTADTGRTEAAQTILPLTDTTMENLNDAVLSVALAETGAYVDDTGKMQMDLKIYAYDQYDMVDIAGLQVGDTIVRYSGEVEVTSIERSDAGMVAVNGGLEAGGFDLVTDDNGTFYEMGFNDHKNWYEVGEATIRVSADFVFTDNADLEQGEVIFYPGSFLIGEVTNYDFTPYNTTVRVEDGQIVEMNRRFIP